MDSDISAGMIAYGMIGGITSAILGTTLFGVNPAGGCMIGCTGGLVLRVLQERLPELPENMRHIFARRILNATTPSEVNNIVTEAVNAVVVEQPAGEIELGVVPPVSHSMVRNPLGS